MMPIFDDSTTKRAEKKHRLDVDFSQAMQKAFWEELKGFILRRSTRLLPFDEVKDKLEIWFVRDLARLYEIRQFCQGYLASISNEATTMH